MDRQPVRPRRVGGPTPPYTRLACLACAGAALGFLLGVVFMGTIHTMLEIRAEEHYREEAGGQAAQEAVQSSRREQAQKAAEAAVAAHMAVAGPAGGNGGGSGGGGGRWGPQEQQNIHTVCTSNGSPYLNFQTRIMYATYRKVQKMPGGERLVAFTRILHRTKPDVLMDEVPTFRADPLTPKCDEWCEFPVADRPDAVEQWMKAVDSDPSMVSAPWILMIETDYVWWKPVQAPRADSGALSIAFPFGYIVPQAPALAGVMRIMYPQDKGPLSDIPNSGPAPVLCRLAELRKIIPDWKRLAYHIEHHKETKDKLGWVREMYGWSIGAALQGVKFDLELPPKQKLIVQPPADRVIGEAALFHYTWGTVIKDQVSGRKLWEFDKRTYTDAKLPLQVPTIPKPPPFRPGLVMQDGQPVTKELLDILNAMLDQMNSVIPSLPKLRPV
eukprot:jgi/Tetstr1/447384/TSEL_034820.t2